MQVEKPIVIRNFVLALGKTQLPTFLKPCGGMCAVLSPDLEMVLNDYF